MKKINEMKKFLHLFETRSIILLIVSQRAHEEAWITYPIHDITMKNSKKKTCPDPLVSTGFFLFRSNLGNEAKKSIRNYTSLREVRK
jgi:hypothetical protein